MNFDSLEAVVCTDCGLVRFRAPRLLRTKMAKSKEWKQVGAAPPADATD